ncbi:MAG: DUF5691 domain-containing protein [Chloroflexota bacterium]
MTDKWNQLVSSSLVGTRNRPYIKQDGDTSLDDLLADIHTDDEEQALLAAAAAIVIYREVGRVQVSDYTRKLPPLAPPEVHPVCSSEAARYLELILDGKVDPLLLKDWMDGAANHNVRVPEKYLLPVMELLATRSEMDIHPATAIIVGERGRWLSTQRKRWKFVNWVDDFDRVWRSVSPRVQDVLFRLLRAAEPDRAREFIAARLDQFDENRQGKFIDWMATGPVTHEDEPFLESLLDEDHRDLNEAAADALRRLPTSAYVQRMKDRVRNRVWIEQDATGKEHLRWEAVSTVDDGMMRDTVDRTGYGSYQRPEAEHLAFMMRCVPPVAWSKWLGKTSHDLVALGAATPALFIRTWTRAVNVYGDREWAQALADYCLSEDGERNQLSLVLPHLPEDTQTEIVMRLWQEDPIKSFETYSTYSSREWLPAFSDRVVGIYRSALSDDGFSNDSALANALARHSFRIHPLAVNAMLDVVRPYAASVKNTNYRQKIDEALRTMEVRASIWRVFQ